MNTYSISATWQPLLSKMYKSTELQTHAVLLLCHLLKGKCSLLFLHWKMGVCIVLWKEAKVLWHLPVYRYPAFFNFSWQTHTFRQKWLAVLLLASVDNRKIGSLKNISEKLAVISSYCLWMHLPHWVWSSYNHQQAPALACCSQDRSSTKLTICDSVISQSLRHK